MVACSNLHAKSPCSYCFRQEIKQSSLCVNSITEAFVLAFDTLYVGVWLQEVETDQPFLIISDLAPFSDVHVAISACTVLGCQEAEEPGRFRSPMAGML